ncbi:MAG TPA: YdiU family protein [Burkholderiales bacterium]|nr:YdiU family protein [Burkholderiales bacterium]
MHATLRNITTLNFDNRYARLPLAFYRKLEPAPLAAPYLVSVNDDAATLLDLDPAETRSERFLNMLAGNLVPRGAEPLAMLYAGHQFGTFVPQLGDGRALLLGEIVNARGERWTLQLKGAGETPFSRTADGRAVLRSTIREYLCSEAMHALGIPTTRALGIAGSDETVYRETPETAAVLLRLAPSHVRFGSFEVFYHRREHEYLKQLADHVIDEYFPQFKGALDCYEKFLIEVVERTARLIAQWQAVGFCHGVMNTDNMSILGLTLDYGPFGFMEAFNPGHICNHSDEQGRYSYENQPYIGLWNCSRLAQALTPLIPAEQCNAALTRYEGAYLEEYGSRMRAKLGLAQVMDGDDVLISDLLGLLAEHGTDFTIFFRALGRFDTAPSADNSTVRDLMVNRTAFDAWTVRYSARLAAESSDDTARRMRMNNINPKYVLRNHLAQIAIDKATRQKDFSEIDRLLTLLRRPFDEQPAHEAYAAPPPDWAKGIEVSCSS